MEIRKVILVMDNGFVNVIEAKKVKGYKNWDLFIETEELRKNEKRK